MKKNKISKICYIIIFIIILIIIFLFLFLIKNSYCSEGEITTSEIINSQKDSLNISQFISQANRYTKDVFKDINFNDLFNSTINGKVDNSALSKCIIALLGKETLSSIRTIGSIIVIIIVHSILVSISDGLENKSISQITYYIQYILIVTLIMNNFVQVIEIIKSSINNLICFSNLLIPILMALIISSGNIASSNILQPIILFMITFMGNFINGIIIPITLASTVLSVISKISDRIQIDKLSKFFKSSVGWILGVILTIFIGVLSIEGTLSSSVDGIAAKTAKAAVSSFIPVVGKILGDAVDTVIGCTTILKNATGIIGVIVIIGICIIPIIKLVTLMTTFYIGAALCEPIADKKIVNLLSQLGDTYKILLAIICSVSIMLIIGVTLVIKISNTGIMYR